MRSKRKAKRRAGLLLSEERGTTSRTLEMTKLLYDVFVLVFTKKSDGEMPDVMTSSKSDPGGNQTIFDVFVLVGFSHLNELQILLFVVLLVIYLLTLMGNLLVILLIKLSRSLHTPMYFFLVNLSASEICFTSSVVPQLLAHLLVEEKTISIEACAAGMYVLAITGLTEGCLLAAMAYDRYVAICHPLHYTTIISGRVCALLAGASWAVGISVGVSLTMWIFSLPLCGSNRIHHFFCDAPPFLEMACADTSIIKAVCRMVAVLFTLGPFLLILLSYIRIISTILKLASVEGRRKAFSTCSSHLTVVTVFYGTALITYLVPNTGSTTESDLLISLLYTIVSPALNPIIYTLRNKEVKGALRKTVQKSSFSHHWRN
ncbi:olfactory receptor 10A4-like [Carettochelys insculpta]|uniref:olfactory receptor 10A4-like n=1 Tax=Carettochelys insculpta TaxID=44489 RepID=UPI003EBAB761